MLIFLIPIQSRKKSDWISGGVIFVVSFSLLIIWNWVVRDDYYSTQVYGMDPRLQFHWFADHPISGIKAVAGGLVVNAHQIAVTYFGLFGWLSIIMPLPWYLLYFLLTIMIFLFEPEKVLMDNTLIRPAMALLPLGVMLLFSLVMYITFTKVGAPFATGFQGRHFMPLMPFLFLGVFHGKNSSRFREKIPSAALLAIIVLNLWAVAAIYCGFN